MVQNLEVGEPFGNSDHRIIRWKLVLNKEIEEGKEVHNYFKISKFSIFNFQIFKKKIFQKKKKFSNFQNFQNFKIIPKFFLFFNATGLLKNWKKQHFICSNLTLFIVPFFLSFFPFFLFFLSFFLFSWGATATQQPSNDGPAPNPPTNQALPKLL